MKCDCTQGRELRPSGWSAPHHTHYCPACSKRWYETSDGSLTKEKPASWPKTPRNPKEIWKAPGA